ncbi:MAG TPA: 2-amino-4-hydroxy-6-hydroxymethyldihydropteridine diphosphokinase [Terriglobales bacterium]|nr:2-amino-4-hydroxy-6-hydroxymethyldihydropteridine diphosphokinase [Terriglobales bacterium]
MPLAYISLGSNVGDRVQNLRRAIAELGKLGTVTKISSFYETEPVEFAAQGWFVNCVVELQTTLTPWELLAALLAIEHGMGRNRSISTTPKGPRNIDLDVILYEDRTISEPGLNIPHPAMQERRFVLAPLAEIAPDAIHPVFMRSAIDLLKALGDAGGTVKRMSSGPEVPASFPKP